MINPQTLAHNTHNSNEPSKFGNSAYCADGSERVRLLLAELLALGVLLSIDAGQLSFDAPACVMTTDRLARLRADREAVVAALLKQTDTPEILSGEIEQPVEPVSESDEMPVGVLCPFCNCRRFQDEPRGMRCRNCSRLAWLFLANGSVVRTDYEKTDLAFDV